MISIEGLAYISTELFEGNWDGGNEVFYEDETENEDSEAYIVQDKIECFRAEERRLENKSSLHG